MSIYQHFRKHEHPFIDQVLSWKEQVERTYIKYVTDFLDPREQQIIMSLIGTTNDTIQYAFFGGLDTSERKRAIIAPYYEELSEKDFSVICAGADFPGKFISLEHRDVLGAFMSLGIDRRKIGDIIVAENQFQFFITEDLFQYIQLNLTQVKKATVSLVEKENTSILASNEKWIEKHHTVSSLRLDILVKEIYKMSRNDAVRQIKANKVKVNFTEVNDPSIQILENDLISLQKYGRSKLMEIGNLTKKDNIHIKTARLKI